MADTTFRKFLMSAVLALVVLLGTAAPAAAQSSSPCPPGQPSGRPPGTPPNQPGPPDGRPPQYPPGSCNLQLSRGSAARGESVTATGSGFAPGETVVLSLGGTRVATLTASSGGAIDGSFTVPADAPLGRTTIEARGGATVLSAAFEVVGAPAADRGRAAPAAAAAGGVARTGSDVLPATAAGLVLVGVGAAFVVLARRRSLVAG